MGLSPVFPEDMILKTDDHSPVTGKTSSRRFHAQYRHTRRAVNLETCTQLGQESAKLVPDSSDESFPVAGFPGYT